MVWAIASAAHNIPSFRHGEARMKLHAVTLDVFGHAMELKSPAKPERQTAVSCFKADGTVVPDIAVIRPYEGFAQYNEDAMASLVKEAHLSSSAAYRWFFLLTAPIQWIFNFLFRMMRGVGRISPLGLLSGSAALIILVLLLVVIGLTAQLAIYLAPLIVLTFILRWTFNQANRPVVERMKQACQELAAHYQEDSEEGATPALEAAQEREMASLPAS
jgi:hypothetical protein